jgi:hypothetical protein
MSAFGTSRLFAVAYDVGRFRSEADMNGICEYVPVVLPIPKFASERAPRKHANFGTGTRAGQIQFFHLNQISGSAAVTTSRIKAYG